MYAVLIKRSAERDLCRLPRALLNRVNERILSLRDEPRPPRARRLVGAVEAWRTRVSDYRIVYQIDDDAQMVTIVRVKHLREVYR